MSRGPAYLTMLAVAACGCSAEVGAPATWDAPEPAAAIDGDAGAGAIADPDAAPPGDPDLGTESPPAVSTVPSGCVFADDAPLLLSYASLYEDDARFLTDDCSLEVVVGQKATAGPHGSSVLDPELRARGLHVGFVSDLNGRRIRDMLLRDHGVDQTVRDLTALLDAGYDYIVIDEITAAADWADGATVNRRFRAMLERMPPRSVIAYVSIDLTMYDGGNNAMQNRRQLFAALMRHARAAALEVYLHTGAVIGGAAPDAFAKAARRFHDAVAAVDTELAEQTRTRAITVLGLSMHSGYAQYNYLDWPANDLRSVHMQGDALASVARTHNQRGIGYYFVNRSDITPSSGAPYTQDDLLRVMRNVAFTRR